MSCIFLCKKLALRNITVKDLTTGSIVNHILTMAAPVAIGMLTQVAYQVIDLYFLARIGVSVTAGVNAASSAALILFALMQVIGVGTVALVANAVGRADHADANLIFNQCIAMAALCAFMVSALLILLIRSFMQWVTVDEATIEAGVTFTLWLLPGYVSVLMMTVLSSALRGAGIVRQTIVVNVLTVIMNIILAPILIAGWGTGVALGVKGAGLATSMSIAVGTVLLGIYFRSSQHYMAFNGSLLWPRIAQWRRILAVGWPTGGEVALMFLCTTVVYYALRNFGTSVQAGYGIGLRVMQIVLLPAISIAFAAAPIVGQNFGAHDYSRVREAFRKAAVMGAGLMIITAIVVQWRSRALVNMFDADVSARTVAMLYLELMSWIFVAQGIVYTCSSVFQGLGKTMPCLIGSGINFFLFSVPVVWLSTQLSFRIEQVWHLAMAAVTLQSIVCLYLLHIELKIRPLPTITS